VSAALWATFVCPKSSSRSFCGASAGEQRESVCGASGPTAPNSPRFGQAAPTFDSRVGLEARDWDWACSCARSPTSSGQIYINHKFLARTPKGSASGPCCGCVCVRVALVAARGQSVVAHSWPQETSFGLLSGLLGPVLFAPPSLWPPQTQLAQDTRIHKWGLHTSAFSSLEQRFRLYRRRASIFIAHDLSQIGANWPPLPPN